MSQMDFFFVLWWNPLTIIAVASIICALHYFHQQSQMYEFIHHQGITIIILVHIKLVFD